MRGGGLDGRRVWTVEMVWRCGGLEGLDCLVRKHPTAYTPMVPLPKAETLRLTPSLRNRTKGQCLPKPYTARLPISFRACTPRVHASPRHKPQGSPSSPRHTPQGSPSSRMHNSEGHLQSPRHTPQGSPYSRMHNSEGHLQSPRHTPQGSLSLSTACLSMDTA